VAYPVRLEVTVLTQRSREDTKLTEQQELWALRAKFDQKNSPQRNYFFSVTSPLLCVKRLTYLIRKRSKKTIPQNQDFTPLLSVATIIQ
jgi:hypothetical protein